jgi:hypothetical protein
MVQMSVVFTAAHRSNLTLFKSLQTFSTPESSDYDSSFGSVLINHFYLRIQSIENIFINSMVILLYGPVELLHLNWRFIQERGLFTSTIFKVNLLFLATVFLGVLLQITGIIAPEISHGIFRLDLLIDRCIAALFAEIPATFFFLEEQLEIECRELEKIDEVIFHFRKKMYEHLVDSVGSFTSRNPRASFLQFDWTLFLKPLKSFLEAHYPKQKIDKIFQVGELSVRERFSRLLQSAVEEEKLDLIRREIFLSSDFTGDSSPGAKAALQCALLRIISEMKQYNDYFVLQVEHKRFLVSQHLVRDPFFGVNCRGFGQEIPVRVSLYSQIRELRSKVEAINDKNELRDLLQNEYVDQSELSRQKTVALLFQKYLKLPEKYLVLVRKIMRRDFLIDQKEQVLLEKKSKNAKECKKWLSKVRNLNQEERSLFYRLLSPRATLNPAETKQKELKNGYFHFKQFAHLVDSCFL